MLLILKVDSIKVDRTVVIQAYLVTQQMRNSFQSDASGLQFPWPDKHNIPFILAKYHHPVEQANDIYYPAQ